MLRSDDGWAMMGAFTPHSQTMSEEQLKAAETEATAEQEEEFGEEISEDDLEGVAGGLNHGLLESGAGISPAR